jgi:hypothetical protein
VRIHAWLTNADALVLDAEMITAWGRLLFCAALWMKATRALR